MVRRRPGDSLKLLKVSHLYAETVLDQHFNRQWRQLELALTSTKLSLNPYKPFSNRSPKIPKRQRSRLGGREAFVLKPVAQTGMNAAVKQVLRRLDWNSSPYVLRRPDTGKMDTYLRGDFEKGGVFIEVEFGNAASLYRDLFKFHVAGASGVGEVAVIVAATQEFAAFFDSGVATYEMLTRLKPYMRVGVSIPTLIVGVTPTAAEWARIRRRYNEMKRECERRRLACHAFTLVRRKSPLSP
jgi:Restriction endonuclease BglII